MNQPISHDVNIVVYKDSAGQEHWESVAHFRMKEKALELKENLEASGEKVQVSSSTLYDFSEVAQQEWFSD